MMTRVTVCAVAVLLVGTACSAQEAATTAPEHLSSAPTSPSPTPTRPDPAATETLQLRDYGAQQWVWSTSHEMDYRYSQGLAWDPTPGLGAPDEHAARFYRLHSEAGIVVRFSMRFPHGSSQTTATLDARTALPRDSTIVWQRGFGSCYVVELRSGRLAAVLGAPGIDDPGGYVQLVFDSHEADGGRPAYSPTDVTGATALSVTARSPSDFAGC
jgi:hypothetical protein